MKYIDLCSRRPLLNIITSAWVKYFGSVSQQNRYGVLDRGNYAYGLMRAAETAKYFGKNKVTVCEFGVHNGNGLLNMISLAQKIGAETQVQFRIVGFDTGEGLTEVHGHKDHPETWAEGEFIMVDRDKLVSRIGDSAELIFGNIEETVDQFVDTLQPDAPLGFISVDVDLYSSTKSALRCLLGKPNLYNPAVSVYFDDVMFFYANKWCGELAAIEEFNDENDFRKIDIDRDLPGPRVVRDSRWYPQMYACHILDHEARQKPRSRQ